MVNVVVYDCVIFILVYVLSTRRACVCVWTTHEEGEEEEGVCIYVRVCDRVPFTQRQHVEMLRARRDVN